MARRPSAGRAVALAVVGVLTALLPSPRLIAQSGDTLRLTSDEAVARMLAGGPEMMRGRLLRERARAERMRTVPFFPSLPELEFSRRTDAPFEGRGEGGWDLDLSQEIEIGGQSGLRRRAADAALAGADLDVRAVELDLRTATRRAFAALVGAEQRMYLADSLASFARRLDTIAGRLLAVGEISELDRNALRIELAKTLIERGTAESMVAEARAELSLLLGIDGSAIIVPVRDAATDPGDSLSAALEKVAAVERALAANPDSLILGRPEWAATERSIERLRAERSLGARRWIPSLRVGASLGSDRLVLTGEDLKGGSEDVRGGFGGIDKQEMLFGVHIGVAVPLPFGGLYDLGQGDVGVADAELALIDAERVLIRSRARADIARAAGRLRAAAGAVGLYSRDVAPLVGRNLELLERGYAAGELGAAEVIAQQRQLVRFREALIDAEQRYAEALADFERVIAH